MVAGAEKRIAAATQEQMAAIVSAAEERINAAAAATEAHAQETARNMQTEILRGLEESSDADANTRITALEERVLYLETRRQ